MIKWNSVVMEIVFCYLVDCSAANEICQRTTVSTEEFNDDIRVLLYTRPHKDTHESFHAQEELNHRWALVFLFPNSRSIVTHEGAVVDGSRVGCSYSYLPNSPRGSSLRLLGNVSGSPKQFDELSRKTEEKLDYSMDMLFYSHNYVLVMARMIGGDIWTLIKNSKILFESVTNLYATKTAYDYDSLRNITEMYYASRHKNRIKTMTWGDFKCLASLGLYAFEATLIPYMLKQGPLILLVYSFAIDFQATKTYEYINKTVDTLNLSDLMQIMVTIAKSLYFCLHWISGTVHTLLVLRFTISVPKMICILVLCCE